MKARKIRKEIRRMITKSDQAQYLQDLEDENRLLKSLLNELKQQKDMEQQEEVKQLEEDLPEILK